MNDNVRDTLIDALVVVGIILTISMGLTMYITWEINMIVMRLFLLGMGSLGIAFWAYKIIDKGVEDDS